MALGDAAAIPAVRDWRDRRSRIAVAGQAVTAGSMLGVLVAKELAQVGCVPCVQSLSADEVRCAKVAAVPGNPVGVAPSAAQVCEFRGGIGAPHRRCAHLSALPTWGLTELAIRAVVIMRGDTGRRRRDRRRHRRRTPMAGSELSTWPAGPLNLNQAVTALSWPPCEANWHEVDHALTAAAAAAQACATPSVHRCLAKSASVSVTEKPRGPVRRAESSRRSPPPPGP